MSFGYDRMPKVFLGDSATLIAALYDADDQQVVAADWASAVINVFAPDGTQIITDQAYAETDTDSAVFYIDGSLISQTGLYRAMASFIYGTNALKKSVPVFFEAVDPFAHVAPTPADGAIDLAWGKLEDCFDSEQGGPWLRDMTLANFSRDKIKDFIPDVMLEINAVMPQTNFTTDDYPWTMDDGQAIFGWGLLLATIRHLMRSYTEQPDQSSSPVPHMDRTRYQQAWSVIYQIEKERYDELLRLFKVRSYADSRASLLIATKAGRLLPGALRTRNVGRGYYKYLDFGSLNEYREFYNEDVYEVQ